MRRGGAGPDRGPDPGPGERPRDLAERGRLALEQGRARFAVLERWRAGPGRAEGAAALPAVGRGAMTRSGLVLSVAARTETTPADADAVLAALPAEVRGALARGGTVRTAGFGTRAAAERPARTGRNPRTGAEIAVPASRTVRFRPGKALRDAVNPERG